VYLARDLKHERYVAIKVFKPELAETLGAERFTREIRTAANLQHPHILTVHDSGVADGLLYYVMPFVEGESLRARITREGGLPIGDVVRILREVADALATAHANGVVHRDIKPDNILLSGRHALVADFGVAKAISESAGRNNVTTVGIALGTPAYMAPEQAAADPHVDHRADIYALGVTGYEMLTGEPPFVRRTPQEVLAAHVTEPAPAVSVRRQSVPPALDALIAKCLLKQPADRYQSADEIVSDLERIATPTAGMSPAAGVPPTARHAAEPYRGARLVRGLTIAAMLAMALAGWLAWRNMRGGAASNDKVVAVLPFEFSGAPALAYLREGIVNVMESNLTGEGGPRAVASATAIAQWKRKGGAERGLTEEEALAVARGMGAGQLLRGSIVAAGNDLVISATLLSTGAAAKPVQAQVKGPADSIASLATQLAGQLLSLRVGEAAERLHSLQMVPPPALRQYLVGQQALRESRFADAYLAFSAALAQDSTFALAGMGLGTAKSWSLTSLGAGDGFGLAYRHRDRLGPRDLVLLEMTIPSTFAGRALSLREAQDIRERLVQQIPDRPEGWYLIGDNYYHRGAAFGLTLDEAARRGTFAFEKVLALDPGVTYVQAHVAQMPFLQGDYQRARHVAESLHVNVPEVVIAARTHAGDTTDVSRYRAEFAPLTRDQLIMVAFFNIGTAVGDSAFDRALALSSDVAARQTLLEAEQRMQWIGGRPAAARRTGTLAASLARTPNVLQAYESVADVVFASGDTIAGVEAAGVLAGRLRPATEAIAKPLPAERPALYMTGLWSSFRNDTAGVSSAIRRLDGIATLKDSVNAAAAARLCADVLRLVAATAAPDRTLVARVDSILRDGPPVGVESRATMNLVLARSWERLGDARHAAAAASRTEVYETTGSLTLSAGARERGRLKLAAGDTAGALDVYRRYLANRNRAEPSQRKIDDDIRRKIAELERLKR